MMYKNANIKDVKEAIMRMMDGERFYYCDAEIFFEPGRIYNPLRMGNYMLSNELNQFEEWEVEVDWRDDLKNKPRLCRIWDWDKSKSFVGVIVDYIGKEYYTTGNRWYANATPLTKEEVKVFMDNAE